MLTAYDISVMEKDVQEILADWNMRIKILRPKPLTEQPNYNKIMHEFDGAVEYDTLENIPAERKDAPNIYIQDVKVEDNTGDRVYGYQTLSVPTIFNGEPLEIDEDCIFIIDDSDDRYFVKSVRPRIGETIITVSRYVGGTP